MMNHVNNQLWLVDMNLVAALLGDDEFPLRRETGNPCLGFLLALFGLC